MQFARLVGLSVAALALAGCEVNHVQQFRIEGATTSRQRAVQRIVHDVAVENGMTVDKTSTSPVARTLALYRPVDGPPPEIGARVVGNAIIVDVNGDIRPIMATHIKKSSEMLSVALRNEFGSSLTIAPPRTTPWPIRREDRVPAQH